MKFHLTFRTLAATLASIALTACNSSGNRPASFNSWQTQMQAYVTNQGNGDMNALRDVRVAPGQAGFRAFSSDRPEHSKDIVGVLVGVQQAQNRLWYVYVVGDVDREQVGTIRLAAVTQADGQYAWRVGDDLDNASAKYRARREQVWDQQHGGGSNSPRSALNFPSAEDQFSMSASGDMVTVRDSACGAEWTLSLAEQAPASAKNG